MGLSFGLGCALSAKMDSSERRIWVMLGDGETQEGQIWEAAMAANYHNATNLRVIVDRNRIQNDDFMDVQMEIGDIGEKFRSFGWTVKEVDGHDMSSLVDVIDWANSEDGGPVAIVANTIKGNGVSFMENNPSFHGKAPDDEELRIALEKLSRVRLHLEVHPEMDMEGLLRIAEDPRVVVLEADLGKSTKSCHFRDEYPDRTVSLGIAEQNMMLVAAGMASSGKIPFASTFAIFTERALSKFVTGLLVQDYLSISAVAMAESILVQMVAVLSQ